MKTEYRTVTCVVCDGTIRIPTCIETIPEYPICGSALCKERIKEYKKVREVATRKDIATARTSRHNQIRSLQKEIERFDYLLHIYDNIKQKTTR